MAVGHYSDSLMKVDLKTGAYTVIGVTPQSPTDGMAWAPNGDLLLGADGTGSPTCPRPP